MPITPAHAPSRGAPAGSIVLLVAGALLSVLGSGLLGAGTTGAGAAAAQQDDGFFTSPATAFTTDSHALTTPSTTEFAGDDASPELPFDIGVVRLRADSDQPLFVGIASGADVDRYLADVRHTEVTGVEYEPFEAQYREIPGSATPTAPALETFWVESASGGGQQEITWSITPGDWAVVVMNADGSAGVSADIDAGFRSDLLAPFAVGVFTAGVMLLLGGMLLAVLGAAGLGRSLLAAAQPTGAMAGVGDPSVGSPPSSPVRLVGTIDEPLSRWLWLVKWVLAVPHYLVLIVLWVGFLASTVVAGIVILFTGRYPRPLFAYNVGVLRWSWRVGFYTYSALGTDRYPPFTLASADYPADLHVDYPERLSKGLVLVKWWLLALPHYVVLAALGTGLALPVLWPALRDIDVAGASAGFSLLAALVLIAAVVLLFTARYPRGLFDLVVGINRWSYRVTVYAALMSDTYPPFRLDQGPDEPARPEAPTEPRESVVVQVS